MTGSFTKATYQQLVSVASGFQVQWHRCAWMFCQQSQQDETVDKTKNSLDVQRFLDPDLRNLDLDRSNIFHANESHAMFFRVCVCRQGRWTTAMPPPSTHTKHGTTLNSSTLRSCPCTVCVAYTLPWRADKVPTLWSIRWSDREFWVVVIMRSPFMVWAPSGYGKVAILWSDNFCVTGTTPPPTPCDQKWPSNPMCDL